jgi:ERCC4-type nuclease
MIIKVDTREPDLLQQLNHITCSIPNFKNIVIKFETLPIGDIIICDENEEKPGESVEKIIIERKSISDLHASIKDGRYEEQSYRLNGLNHHNHNIIYLVEGDVSRVNRYKPNNTVERLTLYSAMFSLNYYKGFSVFRSFSLEESALIICNMAYKLDKESSGKKAFYKNNVHIQPSIETNLEVKPVENLSEPLDVDESEKVEQSEKDYVNVVKKVKKENITPDNIGEIMLCQIPGISSVTALAIMEQYKNIPNLIKELETNNDCLKDITSTNSKGQTRKINKTSVANIVKFLLKK